MKYMNFNAACAYAGLANQLLLAGHSTEDVEIIKAIGLPWYLAYDEETKTYSSGAMLQGKTWFDLYLQPLGWMYEELLIAKKDVPAHIIRGDMIGIQLQPGRKHAVIFLEETDGILHFMNNKHENSDEPEILALSVSEFMDMLPEQTVIGRLMKAEAKAIPLAEIRTSAHITWRQYKMELLEYIGGFHSFEEMWQRRDPLFRALLVDSLTMMTLMQEDKLASRLRELQTQYMNALKQQKGLVLAEHLDMDLLTWCLDELSRRCG